VLRNKKMYFRYSFWVALMWKVGGFFKSVDVSMSVLQNNLVYKTRCTKCVIFFYFVLKRILVSVTVHVAPNSFITFTLLQ